MTAVTVKAPLSPLRPAHPASLPGSERVTYTEDGQRRQLWRQVGWHGGSGAFYALPEDPSSHEQGSFAPLWILVDDEPVLEADEPGGPR